MHHGGRDHLIGVHHYGVRDVALHNNGRLEKVSINTKFEKFVSQNSCEN